ncbi:MAG: molybdopterin-dependent oxidoreductase [Acidimicrobiales bacterium]
MADRTAFRTCPLCEAGCGLEIELTSRPDRSEEVKRIRGDQADVFSAGFICPKGSTLKHLHEDPDWLRAPQVKRDGRFVPVSWDEAFETIAAGLAPILAGGDRNAVGIYLGNPNAHNLAPMFYNRGLLKSVGSQNVFSASTVDQRPKEVSTAMLFGSVAVPVPDLDRTNYLLMLGANPLASNGSLCTAPDFPGRLRRIQERGGKVVVVDPRRSETAEMADQHLAIRPNGDAHLLAAMVHVMVLEGHADPGRLSGYTSGLDQLPDLFARFSPEAVAARTGIASETIRQLVVELTSEGPGAVYGRIGTTCQEFGTLTSWLIDVVNLLSNNLDRVGGAMFTTHAAGQPSTKGRPGTGRGFRMGGRTSRVSGTRSTFGEFPVTVMAEEIETGGAGQIRAMVTVGGNPVSSNPNMTRMDRAFASLEFMVSVDPYINETTRHADVILPPPSALQKSHYDLALLQFGVRNVANYSPAVLPLDDGQMDEGTILLRLMALFSGEPASGPDAMAATEMLDHATALAVAGAATRDDFSPVAGRDPQELIAETGRTGPERLLDLTLRTGPFGDGFGAAPGGISMDVMEANPHGVDLGPLQEHRIPDLLRTQSGTIELFNDAILGEIHRLGETVAEEVPEMVLVGRRHVRSNNSWMHNVRVLTKGRNRCTLQIHPDDADRLGLADGAAAKVVSRVGEVVIDCERTDVVRPGVVSIPHGFGQGVEGVQLRVASEYRGVNTNVLTDEYLRDPVTGNIALNGVPVQVSPAETGVS